MSLLLGSLCRNGSKSSRILPSLWSARTYTSSSSTLDWKHLCPTDTVDLDFDHVKATGQDVHKDQSLVICHGLFGSKQNWRSLSKTLSQQLKMDVFALDLRNHGTSPHASPHDYEHMAADISKFLTSHGLTSGVNLMGHSMGGKAVLAVALNKEFNSPLRTLISVDMATSRGKISQEFQDYATTMRDIEKMGLKSKKEADKILQDTEPDLSIRQFLLTNCSIDRDTKHVTFRVPLEILINSIPAIGDFPFAPGEASWDGPTLFLKGARARYINEKNQPVNKKFFPNMRQETFETGHWVHAEAPEQFVKSVVKFIETKK